MNVATPNVFDLEKSVNVTGAAAAQARHAAPIQCSDMLRGKRNTVRQNALSWPCTTGASGIVREQSMNCGHAHTGGVIQPHITTI